MRKTLSFLSALEKFVVVERGPGNFIEIECIPLWSEMVSARIWQSVDDDQFLKLQLSEFSFSAKNSGIWRSVDYREIKEQFRRKARPESGIWIEWNSQVWTNALPSGWNIEGSVRDGLSSVLRNRYLGLDI